ncbi:hypothetical protein WIS52_22705 [Pseudonocardia nematodicida]|uniref:Uncharacterized protein n=1 Tax=Pseudonocardia nematodicida TaxID=1206997 RepID=A0ABV1KFP3_9PSEU
MITHVRGTAGLFDHAIAALVCPSPIRESTRLEARGLSQMARQARAEGGETVGHDELLAEFVRR